MNSLLTAEHSRSIPLVSRPVTMIMGMDVSHGSPGRSDVPSIAAVGITHVHSTFFSHILLPNDKFLYNIGFLIVNLSNA